MPKKKSPRSAAKYTEQEIIEIRRNSMLENGLYFYLCDHARTKNFANQELLAFLKEMHLKVETSRPTSANRNRMAIFLEYEKPEFLAKLFAEPLKAHLSIDRDYIESDNAIDGEKLKWHYCHYTEIYANNVTIHVYFDSRAQFKKASLTTELAVGNEIQTTITPLTAEQLSVLATNIEHAKSIINQLLLFKHRKSNELAELAAQECMVLRNITYTPDLKEQVLVALKKYEQHKLAAQKYADTLLHISEVELEQIIAEEQVKAASPAPEPERTQTPQPEIKPLKNEEIHHKLEELERRTNKLNHKNVNIFSQINEVNAIYNELVFMSVEVNHKQFKRIQMLFTKLDTLNFKEKLAAIFKAKELTVQFLTDNFVYIEPYIEPKYIEDLIGALIKADTQLEQTRLLNVCDFLHKNSTLYFDVISRARKLDPITASLAATWVLSSFVHYNPAALIMLLKHGVRLDDKTYSGTMYSVSIFNYFMIHISTVYAELYTAIYRPNNDLGHDISTCRDLEQIFKIKLKEFLQVMFQPQFICGLSYEKPLAMLTPAGKRDVLRTSDSFQGHGYPTYYYFVDAIEIAIAYGLPVDAIELILDHTDGELIGLAEVARMLGYLCDINNYFIMMNEDEDLAARIKFDTADKVLLAKIFRLLEKPNQRAINPCISITLKKNADYARPRTNAELTSWNKIFSQLILIFNKKTRNASYQQIEIAIDRLSHLNSATSLIISRRSKICIELGKILLLTSVNPPYHKFHDSIEMLIRILLNAASDDNVNKIDELTGSFYYQVNRLLASVRLMDQPKLLKRIETEIGPFNSFAIIAERSRNYFASMQRKKNYLIDYVRLSSSGDLILREYEAFRKQSAVANIDAQQTNEPTADAEHTLAPYL